MTIQALYSGIVNISNLSRLATASNLTSTAHAALSHMKVANGALTFFRMAATGVTFLAFWQAPLAGLVAQTAINILFDGAQTLTAKEADYTHTTQSKTSRLAKYLFKTALFPLKMMGRMHEIAGHMPLPATFIGMQFSRAFLKQVAPKEPNGTPITINVNGTNIEALIIKCNGSSNWLVSAEGNGVLFQERLMGKESERAPTFQKLAEKMDTNVILFNYPGVGFSEGMPNKELMVESHRAVWRYLEEEQKAKEITSYGWSIGGGVQGEAAAGYEPKEGVRYAFVKDRTFTSLSAAARGMMGAPLAWAAQLTGWNINTIAHKDIEQVIVQTALDGTVVSDGIISADAALASKARGEKVFISADREDHPHMKDLDDGAIQEIAKQANLALAEETLDLTNPKVIAKSDQYQLNQLIKRLQQMGLFQ